MTDAHFSEEPPQWIKEAVSVTAVNTTAEPAAASASASDSADDDPFASSTAASSSAEWSTGADDDPFACFAEQLSVHPATAAAAVLALSPSQSPAELPSSPSPHPVEPAAASLPDSAEYVAALERRLARLHDKRIKQQHKRHVPGSEFLSSAVQANHSHALGSATSSWLDMEGDSAVTAAAAADAVGSTDEVTAAAAAAAAHSSDEEGEDGAGSGRARGPAAGRVDHPIEERVSLLSQHEQLMEDSDIAQLAEAHKAAADALPAAAAAADSDSAQSQREGTEATGSHEDAQSSEADPALGPSVTATTPDTSPPPPPPSQPSGSAVAHRIESSDGDDTAAPVHMAVATASGVVRGRGLYYQSTAYAAQVAGWWEEEEKCVIA